MSMSRSSIDRKAVPQKAVTLEGILTAAQLGYAKKAQAFPTLLTQRKGILLAVDLQNSFLTTPRCQAIVPKVVDNAERFHQVWATRFFDSSSTDCWQQGRIVSRKLTEFSTTLSPVIGKTFTMDSDFLLYLHQLFAALKSEAITTVAVCGVDTNACAIYKTVLNLFSAEIETFVVIDAYASIHGQKCHQAEIELLECLIGEQYVVSFSELPIMVS